MKDTVSAAVVQAAFAQFICRACGLIYDEALGDADSGLAPGTRFADIPDDWACPLCGVTKADFEPHAVQAIERRAAASHAAPQGSRHNAGVVIVGGGRAGWQMAEALRQRDAALPITLVSACSADVYDKPTLSVVTARGLAPEALVRERAGDAAQRLRVRLLPLTQAVHVDAAARRLRTTRGTLRYRALVLAHGAAPRLPASLPPALVWRVNDLVAYRKLRASLGDAPRRVVIVGGGLVGCELANDLALAGHRITVVDVNDRPLAGLLPPLASQRLLQAWAPLSITFTPAVQVSAVTREAGALRVALGDGRSLDADTVVAATGLATPSRLARSAGLAFDARGAGVEVDAAHLRSSDPAIHALGDCVSIGGRAQRYIEPIGRQARAIAAAICGTADNAYAPRPVPLRIKTSSLPITVDGEPVAGGVWETLVDEPGALRMQQRIDGRIAATLTARAPTAAVVARAA